VWQKVIKRTALAGEARGEWRRAVAAAAGSLSYDAKRDSQDGACQEKSIIITHTQALETYVLLCWTPDPKKADAPQNVAENCNCFTFQAPLLCSTSKSLFEINSNLDIIILCAPAYFVR